VQQWLAYWTNELIDVSIEVGHLEGEYNSDWLWALSEIHRLSKARGGTPCYYCHECCCHDLDAKCKGCGHDYFGVY